MGVYIVFCHCVSFFYVCCLLSEAPCCGNKFPLWDNLKSKVNQSFTFLSRSSFYPIYILLLVKFLFLYVSALIIISGVCLSVGALVHAEIAVSSANRSKLNAYLYFSHQRKFSFLANPLKTRFNSHSPVGSLVKQFIWRSVRLSGYHVFPF